MHLLHRPRAALAAVLAAGALVSCVLAAVPAGASTTGPSDCGSRQSCFYAGSGYADPVLAVTNSTNEDTWTSIPAGKRGSEYEAGGSDLFVWDEEAQVWSCIQSGGNGLPSPVVAFGWYYIDYGVTAACDTLSLPPGAPGATSSARPAGSVTTAALTTPAVKTSMVEICHTILNTHHHHQPGLCVSKKGKDSNVSAGNLVVTCDYHCPGKDNYGRVRFQFKYLGSVGHDGYEPMANPTANASLAGATGAQFSYGGLHSHSKYCLASNPTDARGGRASLWNCDDKSFGKFTKWLIFDLTPTSPWKEYALINIYASNAASDNKYYVLSAANEHDSEGSEIRVLSFGLVKAGYQDWDAFPAIPVKTARQNGSGILTSATIPSACNIAQRPLKTKLSADVNTTVEQVWITSNPCHAPMQAALKCIYPGPHGLHQYRTWFGSPTVTKVADKHHNPHSTVKCKVIAGELHGAIYRVGMRYKWDGRWHVVLTKGSLTAGPAGMLSRQPGSGPQPGKFTCRAGEICFFSSTNFNGHVRAYTAAQVLGNSGHWKAIPAGYRGSVSNKSAFSLSVYSSSSHRHLVVRDLTKRPLLDMYGHWCTGPWTSSQCDRHLPAVTAAP